jgi:hypothetical protein
MTGGPGADEEDATGRCGPPLERPLSSMSVETKGYQEAGESRWERGQAPAGRRTQRTAGRPAAPARAALARPAPGALPGPQQRLRAAPGLTTRAPPLRPPAHAGRPPGDARAAARKLCAAVLLAQLLSFCLAVTGAPGGLARRRLGARA